MPKQAADHRYKKIVGYENRIKEQQLCLFTDRTSCSQMRANQLRLYFSSFAYVLMRALRRLGLKAARVDVTARRAWLSLSENYPWQS